MLICKENMNRPIIIIGANLTGLCTALALSRLNQPSILIDKKDLLNNAKDFRAIALSYGSKQILEQIGLWSALEPYAGPIKQIRVTDQYSPLFLHFNNNETLGYLVESHDLQRIAYEHVAKDPNITIFSNTAYELLENNYDQITIRIHDKIYSTNLLIAADGKFSHLRKLANIKHLSHNYKQTAIVCRLQHQLPHDNIAQEIFLPNGPFAILPLKNPNQSGIVWTETPEIADSLMLLEKDKFSYFLNQKFTDYLGEINLIGEIISYPLELILAEKYYYNRIMLIGDSAHSIHPIAGQGFNLGLRDIDALTSLYSKYQNLGLELGCYQSLKEYETLRMQDNLNMAAITDSLNKLFSNNLAPLSILRKLGLACVEQIPPLKKFFMEYAMAKK